MAKMTEPKVSVIIPVYNVLDYIDACLSSVINQTYQNLEIIVINDGSTDGSDEICLDYAHTDARIIFSSQKNEGQSVARNKGITISTGKYLFFIDSDDRLHPDAIRFLVDALQSNEADVAVGSMLTLNPDDKTPSISLENVSIDSVQKRSAWFRLFDNNYHLVWGTCWGKLYKRDLFKDVRFPEHRVYEDLGIMHNLYASCKQIVYCDCKLYFYTLRPSSTTHNNNDKHVLDGAFAVNKRAFDFYELGEKDLFLSGVRQLLNYIISQYEKRQTVEAKRGLVEYYLNAFAKCSLRDFGKKEYLRFWWYRRKFRKAQRSFISL